MLRQPLFFIFMIAGFFYATVLRPFAVAVAAIAVTLDPRELAASRGCRRRPRRGPSGS